MVLSAKPLDCGYLGLDIVRLNNQVFANRPYSFEENCGPLSLLTSRGIPCLAKTDFVYVFTVLNRACANLATSKYLEQ